MKKILEVNTQKYKSQLAKFENAVALWNKVKDEFVKIEIEPNLNEILTCEDVFKHCVNLYWAKFGSQFPNTVTPTKALYLTDFQIIVVEDYVRQLKEFNDVYTVTDKELICTIDKEKYNVYLDPAKEDEYNAIIKILDLVKELKPAFGYSTHLMRALGTYRITDINSVPTPDLQYFRL